jgi:membrane-associated phospholipid phosphatase
MPTQVPDQVREPVSSGSSGPTSPRRFRFRIPPLSAVLLVGVALITVDLARGGLILRLDAAVAAWTETNRLPELMPIADVVDRIGQRGVALPLLFLAAYVLGRRLHTVRPLVLAVVGTVCLNFFVGLIKIVTARESPRTGGPELFAGNMLFPSGHTANVVYIYGLIAALMIRYAQVNAEQARKLIWSVPLLTVLMTTISLYRHTHWLSDLVAGAMIGCVMLQVSLIIDREWVAVRRWAKGALGPAWRRVEWAIRLIRPAATQPPSELLNAAADAAQAAKPKLDRQRPTEHTVP